MKRCVAVIGFMVLAHCAVGNGSNPPGEPAAESNERAVLQHRVIAEGGYGPGALQAGRRSPWVEIALDQAKLTELWAAYVSDDPAPAIDFTNSAVILLLMGPRSTGGYSIELHDLEMDDRVIRVKADLHEPAPESMVTQAFTAPHIAILVNTRDFDSVEWINRDRLLWTELLSEP